MTSEASQNRATPKLNSHHSHRSKPPFVFFLLTAFHIFFLFFFISVALIGDVKALHILFEHQYYEIIFAIYNIYYIDLNVPYFKNAI